MATDKNPLLPKGWPAISFADAIARLTAPGMPWEMETAEIHGRATRVWKHAPRSMRILFETARATHGQKTFLVYQDERATVEAFARATVRMANALLAHGVGKGDRVVIAMRNLPEWPVAYYAAMTLGAIAVPLNAWWTGAELEYGIVDSGAKVAVLDYERYDRLKFNLHSCKSLVHVYVSRSDGPIDSGLASRLEDLLGRTSQWNQLPADALPPAEVGPEDPCTIFYTSGTTGQPKGALGTHRASASTAFQGPFAWQRNCLRRGEPIPTPDPNAPQKGTLIAVPFFHVTGALSVLNPSLANGAKVVMMHRWDCEIGMALIERERLTSAGGVPTIAWQIVEHPNRQNYDLSSLEHMSYGGAPAASELVRRIKEVFPMAAPGIGWGMSETAATFTSHGAEEYINRPESAGPALPVCDMKIVDAQGRTLPPHTVGELWVRGPIVIEGYWHKPEATSTTFVDGWLRTGDLAKIDEEGFLFIVDRLKDMIIRGGENIYCIEVEDTLYQHPAVMDAALIGIPHRTLGEEPAAVVSFKPGASATEGELRAFVASKLAAFKVPVRIVFKDGSLPRNPNGKIMKRDLKQLFD